MAAVNAAAITATSLSSSGVLNVGQGANIDGALDVDSTLDVAGVATMAAVNAAALTATSLSASGDLNIGGAANIDGALDVDSTLNVAGAVTISNVSVTFSGLADLNAGSVASGDKLVIQDADASGVAKEITLAHVGHFIANTGSSTGIQVDSNGQISLTYVEQVLYSGSAGLTADLVTASLNEEPLANSLQVFLNGMLQTREGTAGATYDYAYTGGAGSRKVFMISPVDDDDVLVLKYIKK